MIKYPSNFEKKYTNLYSLTLMSYSTDSVAEQARVAELGARAGHIRGISKMLKFLEDFDRYSDIDEIAAYVPLEDLEALHKEITAEYNIAYYKTHLTGTALDVFECYKHLLTPEDIRSLLEAFDPAVDQSTNILGCVDPPPEKNTA